jgi:hypothetical protein
MKSKPYTGTGEQTIPPLLSNSLIQFLIKEEMLFTLKVNVF